MIHKFKKKLYLKVARRAAKKQLAIRKGSQDLIFKLQSFFWLKNVVFVLSRQVTSEMPGGGST